MAYSPRGLWTPEDDSTSNAVAKVASTASPIMRQATGDAMRLANRRGLMNSSIAVGAATDAVLRKATEIGAADAATVAQKNLSAQQAAQGSELQKENIQGTKEINRENYQVQERMQQTDINSKERMQAAEIRSREDMLGRQLDSEERRQAEQIGANKYMQQQQIGSTERIATADQDLRREMNALQTQTQRAISESQIAQNDRQAAINAAVQMQSQYTAMFDAILSNPDLPADVRATYLEHAKNLSAANLDTVKNLYSRNVRWDGGPAPRPGPEPRQIQQAA